MFLRQKFFQINNNSHSVYHITAYFSIIFAKNKSNILPAPSPLPGCRRSVEKKHLRNQASFFLRCSQSHDTGIISNPQRVL